MKNRRSVGVCFAISGIVGHKRQRIRQAQRDNKKHIISVRISQHLSTVAKIVHSNLILLNVLLCISTKRRVVERLKRKLAIGIVVVAVDGVDDLPTVDNVEMVESSFALILTKHICNGK